MFDADKVVLPGVGSFFCKSKLHENTEVYKSLIDIVIEKKSRFSGYVLECNFLQQQVMRDKVIIQV